MHVLRKCATAAMATSHTVDNNYYVIRSIYDGRDSLYQSKSNWREGHQNVTSIVYSYIYVCKNAEIEINIIYFCGRWPCLRRYESNDSLNRRPECIRLYIIMLHTNL